jgi:hypothetical protein
MNSAAETNGLSIQYCMSHSRHMLQSVELPAVTQARTLYTDLLSQYGRARHRRKGPAPTLAREGSPAAISASCAHPCAALQARASGDYHPGQDQWHNLGTTAMFAHAIGIAPSKAPHSAAAAQGSARARSARSRPGARRGQRPSEVTRPLVFAAGQLLVDYRPVRLARPVHALRLGA